mmetsp:Transcript_47633/g.152090  ORF Transcript_47633/g.152090 Transcript_47633/m.152090 type:complete len:107 (+) Transcript_47633:205-525(+)
MPELVFNRRLSPGLRPGGHMVHACPGYAELLGEWAFGPPEGESLDARVQVARRYHSWFHSFGAFGFYSSDLRCGAEIYIVHFAGGTKSQPSAQKLFAFWAAASVPE